MGILNDVGLWGRLMAEALDLDKMFNVYSSDDEPARYNKAIMPRKQWLKRKNKLRMTKHSRRMNR